MFTENPLLMIDYNACVAKANENKAVVAKLKQKLTDCNEEINKLQMAYEMATKNKNETVL